MCMPFEHISTKRKDDTEAVDEPERRSGVFRSISSSAAVDTWSLAEGLEME